MSEERGMMRSRLRKLAAAVVAVLVPVVASAHHSFAAHFDMDTLTEIEGRITRLSWVNPHVLIYIEDAEGETWEIEAGPVNLLSRMGIERDRFTIGDRVRALGNPGRRGERTQWVSNILLEDDTELLVGPTAEPYWTGDGIGDASFFFEAGTLGTVTERSFFRIWTPLVSGFPRPAEEPRLTEAGRAAAAAYGIGNQVVEDCEVPGMPFAMVSPYPIEIVDRGDDIVIRGEAYDLERIVHKQPLDEAPPSSAQGYSVAHMEADALVVETTRIDYHSYGDLGPAQSAQSRLMERFVLSEDGKELAYEILIEDPVMLAAPWRWAGRFLFRDDAELRPWNCGRE